MTDGDFAAEFEREPLEAIRTLRTFVEFGLTTQANATKWLFPLLIKARGDLRERIYETLVRLEEGDMLLSTALAEYAKYGNEERLALAASLLADIGGPALSALRWLIRCGHPECEFFLLVVARLHGVSTRQKLEILAHAASHTNPDVRYNLLQALRTFTLHEAEPLLRALSHDPDPEIANEARTWLESLEAESQSNSSPSAGFEMDIEESEVFRMPIPETRSLRAIVVNRGPAKPRLVLDFIADEE